MSGRDTGQDLLTRTLRDRSGDMTGSHLGLEQVKGRARVIRRRRRTAGGVVAAVVLAIGVPVGLDVGQLTRGQQPMPTGPSPSATESETPVPTGPIRAVGSAAPRGEDPLVPYLDGRVLHTPDGEHLDLARRVDAVTPFGDGWAGLDPASGTTVFFDSAGRETESRAGASGAVRADGQRVALVVEATGGLDLALHDVAEARPDQWTSTVVASRGTVDLAGFVGPEEVAYNLSPGTGGERDSYAYVTDWVGEARAIRGLFTVEAANEATGVVSGLTSVDELAATSCSAVVDLETPRPRWETCDYTLEHFSPDGRYVLGTDPWHDGIGGSTVAILDAVTGDVVAEFTTRDLGHTGRSVWESDSTLLVSTYQDGAWYLLRLRPDGSVEQALDPVPTEDDVSSPWRFALRP